MTGARRWGLEWAHLDELAALLAPGPAVVISPDVQAHALEDLGDGPSGAPLRARLRRPGTACSQSCLHQHSGA
jgi:hypothetical protein